MRAQLLAIKKPNTKEEASYMKKKVFLTHHHGWYKKDSMCLRNSGATALEKSQSFGLSLYTSAWVYSK